MLRTPLGARVVLCDPHYAPLDPESGEDWRAIERRLHMAPAVKADEIRDMFAYMLDELARRLDARRRGERFGPPMFLAFDELPVIVKHVKGGADSLAELVREGRKVHILTVGASQDFLTKTIGSSSGVRDCYRTAFYVGGDQYSAAALLDMPRREIDDSNLGGGVALLRSNATRRAQLVRVPLASNTGIAGLLGDDAPTMPRLVPEPAHEGPKPTFARPATPELKFGLSFWYRSCYNALHAREYAISGKLLFILLIPMLLIVACRIRQRWNSLA